MVRFYQCMAFLLLAILFVMPQARALDEAPQEEYAFILMSRANPYWQAMIDGIEDTARDNGMNASVHLVESDRAAEEQLNLCLAVAGKKPKLLAMSSVNSSVGIECFKRAKELGVIVADMDSQITPEQAAAAGVPLAFTVGSDNLVIGQSAAIFLTQHAKGTTPEILVLEGAAGSPAGEKRVRGFKEQLAKDFPEAKIISSVSAEWDRLKAMQIAGDTLRAHPNLDYIYAANDLMALGALEAMKSTGKAGQVKVIGVDGIKDARDSVMQDGLLATVAQLPYLVGKRAVELAIKAQPDQPAHSEVTATPVLTKEMLTRGTDPLLDYVR